VDEGGRELLQERLSLYARWFALVTLAYYLVANLPLDAVMGYRFDWVSEWLGAKEQVTLGVAACAGTLWLATRGAPRPPGQLLVLDALGLIAPLTVLSLAIPHAAPPRGDLTEVFGILIGATNAVIARAVVVPSTARRTLVLGAIAFLPVVAATAYAMIGNEAIPARTASHAAISSALWGAVAVATATVASRVIFRLRVEAAEVRRLGQYTLQQKIGQGAMGIVYRASHALLRRPTAIKLLAPAKNSDADLRRFEREVQLTASLTHPNTIAIYDFGRSPDGVFYYAMEYVDGISLEELVRREGPQPAARVIHLLRQASGALEEAHRVGLIHRDVKPANLMVCTRGGAPDTLKVLDFGLVKPLGGGADSLSAVDVAVGTPLYMSPEAIDAPAAVDARSDLYALGAVGYFLLTGTPVFPGKTAVAICSRHLGEAPEPPSRRLGAPVPADLEAVILRCLAKNPADRPASAAELESLLVACGAGRRV
jgi:hypothetical protein